MLDIRHANGALWAANILLLLGIAAFSFVYLLGAEPPNLLADHEPPAPLPEDQTSGNKRDVRYLRELPNPLAPPKPGPGVTDLATKIRVLGTMQVGGEDQRGIAFLLLKARNLHLNAYVGEPIRDGVNDQDVPELAGVKLVSITPTQAVFSVPGREETLKVEGAVAAAGPPGIPGGAPGAPGTPADPSTFTSQKDDRRSNENQEYWNIDPNEAAWLQQNWKSAVEGVQFSQFPGGGLKIDAVPPGSLAEQRGLRPNDVVTSVNGRALQDISELDKLLEGLGRNQQSLTIRVNRSGRPFTLQYSLNRRGR